MKKKLFFLLTSLFYMNVALAQQETKSVLATVCYKVKGDATKIAALEKLQEDKIDAKSKEKMLIEYAFLGKQPVIDDITEIAALEKLPEDKIDVNSKMMILIEYAFVGKQPVIDKCAEFVFVENKKVVRAFVDELYYLKPLGIYVPEERCGFKDEKINFRTKHFFTVKTGWKPENTELSQFFCPSEQKRTESEAKILSEQLRISDFNPKEVLTSQEYGVWVGKKTEEFLNFDDFGLGGWLLDK